MDWHGLISLYREPQAIGTNGREILAAWLAVGLDPNKVTIFKQSGVPAHLEMFWILSVITGFGALERVPTWKDALAEMEQTQTHSLGRFSYPVLQCADVVVYRAQAVPVGADQVAHLELCREIIRRVNHLWGLNWPEIQPILSSTPYLVGTDGRKMSKSYQNTINFNDGYSDLQAKIRHMPTDTQRVRRQDPGEPDRCPVYQWHRIVSPLSQQQEIATQCRRAGIGCFDCKNQLVQNLDQWLSPMRERYHYWCARPGDLDDILHQGSQKAQKVASQTVQETRQKLGL